MTKGAPLFVTNKDDDFEDRNDFGDGNFRDGGKNHDKKYINIRKTQYNSNHDFFLRPQNHPFAPQICLLLNSIIKSMLSSLAALFFRILPHFLH